MFPSMVSFHVTWTLQESVKYLKRSWYQLVFWLWHLKFKEICLFSAGFASCIMRQVEYMSKRPHYQNAPYQNAPTFYQIAPVLLPKRPHYFFRIKIILPKRCHFFIAKTARLIFFLLKRWYHVWYLVIQDLSSKFIYYIYKCTCLFYIRRKRTCIYMLR